MDDSTRRSVFRNPLAWVGLGLIFVSLVGLVLAIGNLVSLQYTPLKLMQQLRDQYASRLTMAGVSPEIIQQIQIGNLISDAARSKLSKDQAQSLNLVEDHLSVFINAVSQAIEISQRKSQTGIVIFIILMVIGGVLTVIAFRQTKRLRSEPA